MNISHKKILVTGADGFVGSHLTEALLDMGCHVRALSLYNSFNDWGCWLEAIKDRDRDRDRARDRDMNSEKLNNV